MMPPNPQQPMPPMDPNMAQSGGMPQPPQPNMMMEENPGMEEQPETDDESGNEEQAEAYLDYALSQANLAKKLNRTEKGREELTKIASELLDGYALDEESRKDWIEQNKEWLKLAMLVRETKSYPWPKASNVKYPLLATAAMQFSARAYPALVPSDGKVVKARINQLHADQQIYDAAQRVSNHMSYQIMERLPNWEQDMDKLLMTMAISGICFKKTYHNPTEGVHHSHLVYPENFCVNYWAKSLEKAYRKTEILYYNNNDVKEKVNNDEEFLDVDYPTPNTEKLEKEPVANESQPVEADKSTPHVFLACHTYWDLDDDGYEEPYIITIHKESKQVVRIIARWDSDGIVKNDKGDIIKIKPIEYFTAFPFLPNPDGSIYALGFGVLLGSLNESVNTIINQLVDSGTLNNLQSGWIGKGLRLQMKTHNFLPGEWKVVNATGDDLHKQVVPLPTKEPSGVLMSLLNMLIQSGNQLASIAEIFVGKMPGQNTPATTTQETVQQSMAVFTAIYKRVYRSLSEEYRKLYRLNRICPDIVTEESQLSGIPLQQSDYMLPDWVITPGADPVGDSTTVRQAKMQQVGSLLQLGTIDPMKFTQRMLEINDIPNAQDLMKQPSPPPPDPKAQAMQAKMQMDQQKAGLDSQAKQQDMQIKERIAALEEQQAASKLEHENQLQAMKLQGQDNQNKMDMVMSMINHRQKLREGQLNLATKAEQHNLALQHKDAAFQQSQKQSQVKGKSKKKE